MSTRRGRRESKEDISSPRTPARIHKRYRVKEEEEHHGSAAGAAAADVSADAYSAYNHHFAAAATAAGVRSEASLNQGVPSPAKSSPGASGDQSKRRRLPQAGQSENGGVGGGGNGSAGTSQQPQQPQQQQQQHDSVGGSSGEDGGDSDTADRSKLVEIAQLKRTRQALAQHIQHLQDTNVLCLNRSEHMALLSLYPGHKPGFSLLFDSTPASPASSAGKSPANTASLSEEALYQQRLTAASGTAGPPGASPLASSAGDATYAMVPPPPASGPPSSAQMAAASGSALGAAQLPADALAMSVSGSMGISLVPIPGGGSVLATPGGTEYAGMMLMTPSPLAGRASSGPFFLGSQPSVQQLEQQRQQLLRRINTFHRVGGRRMVLGPEPPRHKAHHDFMMEEMEWMAGDFRRERKWHQGRARKLSQAVLAYWRRQAGAQQRGKREEELAMRRGAKRVAAMIKGFWRSIHEVVRRKWERVVERHKKRALDRHLEDLVSQTERFSAQMAQRLREPGASPLPSPVPSPSASSAGARPKRQRTTRAPGSAPPMEGEGEATAGKEEGDEEEFEVEHSEEEDDEETMEQEEAAATHEGADVAAELTGLNEEAELSLDELMARYGLVRPDAQPSEDEGDSGEDGEKKKGDAEDEDEEVEEGDEREQEEEDGSEEVEEEGGEEEEEEDEEEEMKSSLLSLSARKDRGGARRRGGEGEENEDEEEAEEDGEEEMGEEGERGEEESQLVEAKEAAEHGVSASSGEQGAGIEQAFSSEEARVTAAAERASAAQPHGFTYETVKVKTPVPHLLRGTLREYQHIGLDWLVSMYDNDLNGILADEMGLGKTIQTIALLAYLACERSVWGQHLIVVPTSVMINWEMEFKRWLPGFKILCYHGNSRERRLKRRGWSNPHSFHACITSYQLVLQDRHIFSRKRWHYMVLDEAQHIKNFASQRWQVLIRFKTARRLLLTGTPLQNDILELWSLMHFLMPGVFQSQSEFKQWFSKPVTSMIEQGRAGEVDGEIISRLHGVLRPFLLRRLKRDVERQLPSKREKTVKCRLSRRQRELYEDFMAASETRKTLTGGNFVGLMNVLMQLRKVCNHPDLFAGRPIVSPFDQGRSVELVVPSAAVRALERQPLESLAPTLARGDTRDLEFMGLMLNDTQMGTWALNYIRERQIPRSLLEETGSAEGQKRVERSIASEVAALSPGAGQDPYLQQSMNGRTELLRDRAVTNARHHAYTISQHCRRNAVYTWNVFQAARIEEAEMPSAAHRVHELALHHPQRWEEWAHSMRSAVKLPWHRVEEESDVVRVFTCIIPPARAPQIRLHCPHPDCSIVERERRYFHQLQQEASPLVGLLHPSWVRTQIYFPDRRLIQFDCGKLQSLAPLLQTLRAQGHRVLIFTQMTRMLDLLETFLNIYGYNYLRLDGSTRVDDRMRLMERFNNDDRIFCFILSTRAGGVGVNLAGADTVIFYDTDWNPAIDQQAQDRCHRIGQTREVTIYRLVTENTVEENILRKSLQKRRLNEMVIGDGRFTTEFFEKLDPMELLGLKAPLPSPRAAAASEQGAPVSEVPSVVPRAAAAATVDAAAAEQPLIPRPSAAPSRVDIEIAMTRAEDEDDRVAAKHLQDEVREDLAVFEEGFNIEDYVLPRLKLEEHMSRVEKYALHYAEDFEPVVAPSEWENVHAALAIGDKKVYDEYLRKQRALAERNKRTGSGVFVGQGTRRPLKPGQFRGPVAWRGGGRGRAPAAAAAAVGSPAMGSSSSFAAEHEQQHEQGRQEGTAVEHGASEMELDNSNPSRLNLQAEEENEQLEMLQYYLIPGQQQQQHQSHVFSDFRDYVEKAYTSFVWSYLTKKGYLHEEMVLTGLDMLRDDEEYHVPPVLDGQAEGDWWGMFALPDDMFRMIRTRPRRAYGAGSSGAAGGAGLASYRGPYRKRARTARFRVESNQAGPTKLYLGYKEIGGVYQRRGQHRQRQLPLSLHAEALGAAGDVQGVSAISPRGSAPPQQIKPSLAGGLPGVNAAADGAAALTKSPADDAGASSYSQAARARVSLSPISLLSPSHGRPLDASAAASVPPSAAVTARAMAVAKRDADQAALKLRAERAQARAAPSGRVRWTSEEDELLMKVIGDFGYPTNWELAADILNTATAVRGRLRSSEDCLARYAALISMDDAERAAEEAMRQEDRRIIRKVLAQYNAYGIGAPTSGSALGGDRHRDGDRERERERNLAHRQKAGASVSTGSALGGTLDDDSASASGIGGVGTPGMLRKKRRLKKKHSLDERGRKERDSLGKGTGPVGAVGGGQLGAGGVVGAGAPMKGTPAGAASGAGGGAAGPGPSSSASSAAAGGGAWGGLEGESLHPPLNYPQGLASDLVRVYVEVAMNSMKASRSRILRTLQPRSEENIPKNDQGKSEYKGHPSHKSVHVEAHRTRFPNLTSNAWGKTLMPHQICQLRATVQQVSRRPVPPGNMGGFGGPVGAPLVPLGAPGAPRPMPPLGGGMIPRAAGGPSTQPPPQQLPQQVQQQQGQGAMLPPHAQHSSFPVGHGGPPPPPARGGGIMSPGPAQLSQHAQQQYGMQGQAILPQGGGGGGSYGMGGHRSAAGMQSSMLSSPQHSLMSPGMGVSGEPMGSMAVDMMASAQANPLRSPSARTMSQQPSPAQQQSQQQQQPPLPPPPPPPPPPLMAQQQQYEGNVGVHGSLGVPNFISQQQPHLHAGAPPPPSHPPGQQQYSHSGYSQASQFGDNAYYGTPGGGGDMSAQPSPPYSALQGRQSGSQGFQVPAVQPTQSFESSPPYATDPQGQSQQGRPASSQQQVPQQASGSAPSGHVREEFLRVIQEFPDLRNHLSVFFNDARYSDQQKVEYVHSVRDKKRAQQQSQQQQMQSYPSSSSASASEAQQQQLGPPSSLPPP